MAPKRRHTKAVARSCVAEPRRSGRAAASSADVAEQSGLAMSTPKSEASSRTRTPRKPAAKGKWSEEHLLTSDKSLLIDFDLVKLLAQPEAWNCLEESDKREILDLLPPDVHPEAQITSDDPDAKIPPIPDSFIRYSNNWRDGVRQFQLDLQNGRYDPGWLHQAQEARQQRENGDFDNFKEREYEQFWGQKQKVDWRAPAGESARVKIGTLIDEGVIQLGDIWKFYYVYGRGAGRIVIEKEVRLHDRVGAKLTFAIPPGERVFLRSNFDKGDSFLTPEKREEDAKIGLHAQPQPVAPPCNDAHLKNEELESQATNGTSNGDDMKLDTDHAPQETPASGNDSANDKAMKPKNGQPPHGIPAPSTDEMNIETHITTEPNISPSNDQGSQEESPFSVIILSPGGTRNQKPKRTIPEPEPQPPVKRKRGRPRKNPPKQPAPEPPREPEVSREIELSQLDEPKSTAPPSFNLSLAVAAKIEENRKAAAESSHLEPSQPEHPLSALSSTPGPPEIPAPGLCGSIEPSIANANVKNGTSKSLEVSTAQSDAPIDNIEAPAEAEQDEVNNSTTEPQKDPIPTSSQMTTGEPEDIIVSGIPSPQALVLKILQIDGRMPNSRTANAWKEIRCYRNNQDMGSLFDVREAWFLQHGRLE
ncbi:uncharacterized protein N7500_001716 [Penicillium coprophilum]|uniref:uncharacterized protein n=1 Tax=Penicillium coprophilum TaxID=36646 RepID=UPI00239556EE|nr:uncharacterized protein N7500_001716 [Penicillium coprophilum]KAJ5173785.1 hypothetical protein N7500_001716 [Penicillium coprophilum]